MHKASIYLPMLGIDSDDTNLQTDNKILNLKYFHPNENE